MEPKFDIFISYRRKGGYETAKHLYDLLTRDGYRVSFDIDTLRSGDFDVSLLARVEECKGKPRWITTVPWALRRLSSGVRQVVNG